jgi:uncharacterized protein YybS (DUF2232 family)
MAPTRDILTGIAATVAVFAVTLLLPVIGFFCTFLMPLPVLFYRVKLGRKPAAVIAGISAAIMAAVVGSPAADLIIFVELMLVGFLLAELYPLGFSVEQTILFTAVAAAGAALAALAVFSIAAGKGPVALIGGYVGENLRVTLEMYRQMGVSPDTIDRIEGSLEQIQFVLVRVLPSIGASGALLISWACLLISRPMLRSRGLPSPEFGTLNRWRAPEQLVWVAIACGAMLLIPVQTLKIIGINGVIILMTVYFFQGIAIVSFFFEKKQLPVALRFILYSLIVIQQFLLLVVIGFGFFDMWLNFRKIERSRDE